jgi:hypothetical protein
MDVRVEETGYDGTPAEIDHLCVRSKRHRLPDSRDASVSDRHCRPDNTSTVDELSVCQDEVRLGTALENNYRTEARL